MRRALIAAVLLTTTALLSFSSVSATPRNESATTATTSAKATAATPTESAGYSAEQEQRLRDAVSDLRTATETRTGYDRDKFKLWVDADGDCRDTRDNVLADESQVAVSGCDITHGRWYSYYDARTWRDSGDVDIDHLVPLAEAWDSGARRWNPKTRERYANDLDERRSLVAVTDNVNQSKGDQDIHEWLPDHKVCRYVQQWVVVKSRWSLTVDRAEKAALTRLAGNCANAVLHWDQARVGIR